MTTKTLSTTPRRWDIRKSLETLKPYLSEFFVNTLGQVRLYKKIYPGIMHAFIFWGVTVQVLGTAINLMQMQLFIPFVELPFPRGAAYLGYELIMDIAGVAIILGVFMAAIRRFIARPKTLENSWDDAYALTLLGLLPLVGFATEAARFLSTSPAWASWSPVGNALAHFGRTLGMTPEMAASLHPVFLYSHIGLGLALVASIPFTKLRHLIFTPLQILVHPRRKLGALSKIENIDDAEKLGVGKITEFQSIQLLSFDACVRCGRCEEACPATISGMAYTPKNLIQSLRSGMLDTLVSPNGHPDSEILGEVLPEDFAWSCTTCGACLVKCPAFVNPVDAIIDLRRYQALTTGKLPKSVADTLRNMERQGNPWGMPPEDRLAWAEGLELRELAPGDETDVLLFLGCAFAFDDRNKKVARSFARLLVKAGVDFGILGFDEMCCGETARRMGHEYLFQTFAEQNIEVFSKIKFNRIVTQCPHCFNTLKNEYPQMGGNFKVQHYTEFLAELQLPGMMSPANGNGAQARFAVHDSCYLGRYNNIYAQPRQLLDQSKVKRVELARKGENSFCCGGGGGQMWLETDAETRINHRRLDEVLSAKADAIATACPYCLLMFDDAIRSKGLGEQVQVLDIAEILDHQLEPGQEQGA